MKKLLMAGFVLLGFMAPAMAADQCSEWISRESPVTMEACSNKDGGSGYYRITNTGTKAAKVCWTIISSSGKPDGSCNLNMKPGEATRGSCFRCGAKNEGVQRIELKSYVVIGEKSAAAENPEAPARRSESTAAAPVQSSPSRPEVAMSPVGRWLVVLDDNGDKTTMVLNAGGGGMIAGEFPLRWTREGNRADVTGYGSQESMQRNEPGAGYQLEIAGNGMRGTQLPLRVRNVTYPGHPITLTRQ